ncbi:MAG: hypothetical protein AB7O65_06815 [Candidatus Korobacteraceae bacterium]
MRKAISVVLVLAFMLGVVPTFSTPAHAWGGFNWASVRQTAINVLINGCLFNCGFGEAKVEGDVFQINIQSARISQR